MNGGDLLVLVLSLEGLLFVVIGRALPGVGRNHLVGIRYPATLADERVWRETHERFGPRFGRMGWAILLGGLVLVALPLPEWLTVGAFLALMFALLAWIVVDSWRYSRRRLQHYRAQDACGGEPTGQEL